MRLIKLADAINAMERLAQNDLEYYGCWTPENFDSTMAINALKDLPEQTSYWIIDRMNTYDLAYGACAYEPVYRCASCGLTTESYVRLDEPNMPEDADFPKYCPHCGIKMEVRS